MPHPASVFPMDACHPGWLPEDLQAPESSMAFLDALFEGNPDMVLLVDADGRIAGANARVIGEFGFPRHNLEGQPIEVLLPAAVCERHSGHLKKYFEHPTTRAMGSSMNLNARDRHGKEFPVDVMLHPFAAAGRQYVMAICRRLDAPLARSRAQIHALVDSAPDVAVNLLDAQGRILTWNEGARRIYNMTASLALGRDFSVLFTPEEIAAGEPRRQMELASRSMEGVRTAGWRKGAAGQSLWVEGQFRATRDLAGNLSGFAKVTRDMSAQKALEEAQAQLTLDLDRRVTERTRQLEESVAQLQAKNGEVEALVSQVSQDLNEKEVLLREVYHRVKNNLQMVQSLLKMGSRTMQSSDARQAIDTAVQRVHVMAMVHEHLYQMPNLSRLSLPEYLRDVVEGAIASNSERPERVRLEMEIEEIPVPVDFAIPLGLLANELVSNCIKHGIPRERSGKVTVSARILGEMVRLVVQDDGVGLPDDFDAAKSTSMGLKLAASLAHQLGGRLEFSSSNGCRVQADLAGLIPRRENVEPAVPSVPINPAALIGAMKKGPVKSLARQFADPSRCIS